MITTISRAFWSYVVAGLRRAGVAVPEPVTDSAREDADRHAFLLRLASMLAPQDPPVVLIIDDLHLVTDPRPLDGLAYLLRHAGSGFRLVVASRTDPLLPLHRYRLTGELTEIRTKEFAFTVAEAERLMTQHGVTLQAEGLKALINRTEGWAAGLRDACRALAERASRPKPVRRGLRRRWQRRGQLPGRRSTTTASRRLPVTCC